MIKYEDYIKAYERQEELYPQVKEYIIADKYPPHIDPDAPEDIKAKYEEMLSYNRIVGIGDILFA
jgi:hypothetical protein